MTSPNDVIDFWLCDVGPKRWYVGNDALDDTIREKFLAPWKSAKAGEMKHWTAKPETMLSYLILLDQFPRNMFRGSADAFASDKEARAIAKKAIDKNWDMRISEPERQFFYLPLMHSECLADQERCVRLMKTRMPETGHTQMIHAKAHREVIRRFGRFPYRNAALSRKDTALEVEFMAQGGYQVALAAVQPVSA